MVYSMTGYGRARAVTAAREITVEIKSVNSRYFEYSSRMPRAYGELDDKIKKTLSERISRGKVEAALTIVDTGSGENAVAVNQALAKSYLDALNALAQTLDVPLAATAAGLSRYPDVLTPVRTETDLAELWAEVEPVAGEALANFVAMRAAEGEKMVQDVLSRLDFLEAAVGQIEQSSEGRVAAYTQRLFEKLKLLLEDRSIDDARILTEAAIFGDKTAVDEETVRLRSHLHQYREILKTGGPVGRKLDFLTQELNRETNTIGSKCQDLSITRLVVDMKAEIEKIREQIQNLE